MQPKWQEELEALRRKLVRQNEEWERVEEFLATYAGPIPVPSQFIAELDRTCDVSVRVKPSTIHNGAIRV
jgi:hypothetical protein